MHWPCRLRNKQTKIGNLFTSERSPPGLFFLISSESLTFFFFKDKNMFVMFESWQRARPPPPGRSSTCTASKSEVIFVWLKSLRARLEISNVLCYLWDWPSSQPPPPPVSLPLSLPPLLIHPCALPLCSFSHLTKRHANHSAAGAPLAACDSFNRCQCASYGCRL